MQYNMEKKMWCSFVVVVVTETFDSIDGFIVDRKIFDNESETNVC